LTIMRKALEFSGNITLFALRCARRILVPPFELRMTLLQIEAAGWESLTLVLSSGFALGLILSLHTRSTLIRFGGEALLPSVESLAFFNEIGPLVVGLLLSGRVGARIGAELADMRASEQIDAIEVLSIDSFKLLVIPRIIACAVALPVLTVFMDVAGLAGGYLAERTGSHLSLQLYVVRAFQNVTWATFIPPTLKTMVFGAVIGLISN
jgi:phospholipid/cholesterol/gamma-HCH transport system permease protein